MLTQIVIFYMATSALYSNRGFEDWNEKNPKSYAGTYVYFEFEGNKIKTKTMLTVVYKESKITLHQKNNNEELTLCVCSIDKNIFYTPDEEKIRGRFVLKYPPANAKGPVEKGILLENKFYAKTE